MNYLNNSNYLGNYPYNYANQYVPQPQPQQFISQPMAPQTQQPQSLNGKIVDSEDVVKATEVPIGGYGVFPKADLSEIYIKAWNNNGTTSITTFKPLKPIESTESEININTIFNKITSLENKIDSLTLMKNNAVAATITPPKQEIKSTKEIKPNDY